MLLGLLGAAAPPEARAAAAAAELAAWRALDRAWALRRCVALAAAGADAARAAATLDQASSSSSRLRLGRALTSHAALLRASGDARGAAAAACEAASCFGSGCVDEEEACAGASAHALRALCGLEARADDVAVASFRDAAAVASAGWARCAEAMPADEAAQAAPLARALADAAALLSAPQLRAACAHAASRLECAASSSKAAEEDGGEGCGCAPPAAPSLGASLLAAVVAAPLRAPGEAADVVAALAEALAGTTLGDDVAFTAAPLPARGVGGAAGALALGAALRARCCAAAARGDTASALAAADAAVRATSALVAPPPPRATKSTQPRHADHDSGDEAETPQASDDASQAQAAPAVAVGGELRWCALTWHLACLAAQGSLAEALGLAAAAEKALEEGAALAALAGGSAAHAAFCARLAQLRRRAHAWDGVDAAADAAETALKACGGGVQEEAAAASLLAAELARARGDAARRRPRGRLAFQDAGGSAAEQYDTAAAHARKAQASPLWTRLAATAAARAALGAAKCAAAAAASPEAALAAAEPLLRSALASLGAASPDQDCDAPAERADAATVAASRHAPEEAALLLQLARLRAAVEAAPAAWEPEALAAAVPVSAEGTDAAPTKPTRRGARAPKAAQTAAPAPGDAVLALLRRAASLCGGAPCLARAVAAAAAQRASAGPAAAATRVAHALGAAAAAELRLARASAALEAELSNGGSASSSAALPPDEGATEAGTAACTSALLSSGAVARGAVVTLSMADGARCAGAAPEAARLLLTRLAPGAPPLALLLPAPRGDAGAGLGELAALLAESDACRSAAVDTPARRKAWWNARLALDARLAAMLQRLDAAWLGAWRALLRGEPPAGSPAAQRAHAADAAAAAVLAPLAWPAPAREAARLIAAAVADGAVTRAEAVAALRAIGAPAADADAAVAAMADAGVPDAVTPAPRGRRPAAAAVAAARPAVADEAAPPAGAVLLLLDAALQALPWESMPGLRSGGGQRLCRSPAVALTSAAAECAARQGSSAGVDVDDAYYLLNPGGDLEATQAAFEPLVASRPRWRGAAGAPPPGGRAAHAAALSAAALFLYFGHGGGQRYLPAAALRRVRTRAAALLMGCSSGALPACGDFPPAGIALAYLAAGCPSVVANLWDVTDRDIDRFADALLRSWLDGAAHPGAADVTTGLEQARAACRLPALTGAAPVCYGLPAPLWRSGDDA